MPTSEQLDYEAFASAAEFLPVGFKYPNTMYLLHAMIAIPRQGTLDFLYSGSFGPLGYRTGAPQGALTAASATSTNDPGLQARGHIGIKSLPKGSLPKRMGHYH